MNHHIGLNDSVFVHVHEDGWTIAPDTSTLVEECGSENIRRMTFHEIFNELSEEYQADLGTFYYDDWIDWTLRKICEIDIGDIRDVANTYRYLYDPDGSVKEEELASYWDQQYDAWKERN